MDTLIIRTLDPDEWSRYRTLRLEALRTEPHAFASSLTEQQAYPETYWRGRLVDALAPDRAWLYFAEQGDRLVRMMGATVKDDPHTAILLALFVSVHARRLGIGTALLQRQLDALTQRPASTYVTLRVNDDQDAAIRLHKRFQFRVLAHDIPSTQAENQGSYLAMGRSVAG